LIDKGADVNAKDSEGITPLFNAVIGRNIEVIKLLIDKGAEANAKGEQNKNMIHYILMTTMPSSNIDIDFSILNLLIQSGSDINCRCIIAKIGTPLRLAQLIPLREEIITFLKERGATL